MSVIEGTGVKSASSARHRRLEESKRRYAPSVVDHEREINDDIGLTDQIKGQARHGEHGVVAPHIQFYSEVKWSHDRQRMERREMHVDSENDYYRQEWFRLETGETTWGPKEGSLKDLRMHGESARRGKKQ